MTIDLATVQSAPTLPADTPQASVQPSARSNREDRTARIRSGNKSRRLVWDKARTAELFRRCRATNDSAARDELITMYLNLVHYLAGKYRNRSEPIDDLVQVGTIGLIKAVDRFDTGRGLGFTTYATPTILGEIKRHFRDKGWALRVPRRLQEISVQINRAMDALTRELQRSPTIPEIAERVGVSEDLVLEATEASSAAYNMVPIDTGYSDGEGVFNVEDRTTLAAALKDVSPVAQRALHLRFSEGLTQTEIAGRLGVSQMQVSRLLRKALAVLRANIVTVD
jgi:RNA polymerase sigma-B factor